MDLRIIYLYLTRRQVFIYSFQQFLCHLRLKNCFANKPLCAVKRIVVRIHGFRPCPCSYTNDHVNRSCTKQQYYAILKMLGGINTRFLHFVVNIYISLFVITYNDCNLKRYAFNIFNMYKIYYFISLKDLQTKVYSCTWPYVIT